MSFESFYGGRMGASFVVRKRFDGINIPQTEETKIYKAKMYAYKIKNDNIYILVKKKESATGNDFNNDYDFIERTAQNYFSYDWERILLNGAEVDVIDEANFDHIGTKNTSELLAEGMVQCFAQGGNSTNEVNYGEYVIIDTLDGLSRRNDPDNGKVFRRGMNYIDGDLKGAEYIGQIIGPQGDTPDIALNTIKTIEESTSWKEDQEGAYEYTTDGGIVPGKTETGEFNDKIRYAWVNLKDDNNNIDKALIGFEFPYLVVEFIGQNRSPYDEQGHILPLDFELIEKLPDDPDDPTKEHPFYDKWKINIPHGIKGDTVEDIKIYPTYAREGSIIYSDQACTIPTGQIVSEGGLPLDMEQYDSEVSYLPLVIAGETRYVKKEDGWKTELRYKIRNYETQEQGEVTVEILGDYNDIVKIESLSDGTVKVYYSNKETQIFPKVIKWLNNISINTYATNLEIPGTGNQKIHLEWNDGTNEDIGEPLNYIIDTFVVPQENTEELPMSDAQLAYKGQLLVYFSDPIYRENFGINSPSFPSRKLGTDVNGWVTLGDIHGITQTPLVFHEYSGDIDSIPDWAPEIIMGNVGYPEIDPNRQNPRYRGYGAIYTNSETHQKWVAQFDYMTGHWTEGFPYGEGIQSPKEIISLIDAGLKIDGFKINKINRKIANELGRDVFVDLSQKTENGYNPNFIGSEARYIGAQRNSNNNNLEEQLVIGTDTQSTIVYNEQADRIQKTETILYKDNTDENTSDYYEIVKTTVMDKDIQVDSANKKLILNLNPHIYSHNEVLSYKGNSEDPSISVSSKNTVYTYTSDNQIDISSNIANNL